MSTKLDARIPTFSRPADVETFLHPASLGDNMLGGAPFFTYVYTHTHTHTHTPSLYTQLAYRIPRCSHIQRTYRIMIIKYQACRDVFVCVCVCVCHRSVPAGRVGDEPDAVLPSQQEFRAALQARETQDVTELESKLQRR